MNAFRHFLLASAISLAIVIIGIMLVVAFGYLLRAMGVSVSIIETVHAAGILLSIGGGIIAGRMLPGYFAKRQAERSQ